MMKTTTHSNRISQVSSFLIALVILSLATLSAPHSSLAARVYLDITAPESRKISIAVPWFVNKGLDGQKQSLGRDLADTLAKALKFHGVISIVPTESYGGDQAANWSGIGADYVALGSYEVGSQGVQLEMRLLDVNGNEVILGKSYSGTLDQKDPMLFKFCDIAVEELTGTPGIASSRIVFVSYEKNSKDIFLTDILGKKIRQVTRHNNLAVSPRFTPDGNFMSYSSYHTGNQNLYITDLRQSKTTKVISKRKGMNLAPAWAPNGQSCVLTLSASGTPDLYRMDRSGNILEQLTKQSGINVSPSYSPDGQFIVFVSDRSGKPQLYLMDLKTKGQKRLTFEGTENAEPNWSPVENKIVYSSLRGGVYQICSLDPFSQEPPQQITNDSSRYEAPVWSPDGKQIMFSKREGRRQQIYAIMANGTYQRRVFTFPGSQSSPRWAR